VLAASVLAYFVAPVIFSESLLLPRSHPQAGQSVYPSPFCDLVQLDQLSCVHGHVPDFDPATDLWSRAIWCI